MANSLEEFSLVIETSIGTGTGALALLGAVEGGPLAFGDVLSNGKTALVRTSMGENWEIATVTYTSSGNSLTRDVIHASTNGGAAVNWGVGTKQIRLIRPGLSDLDDATRAALLELMMTVSEVTVASASTCDILGAASPRVAISGTTTITSFGTGANKIRFVRFSGALTLTHNGTTLILPGAGNVVTAAGDTCIVVSDGSSNARVLAYQRGASVPLTIASTTNVLNGASVSSAVTPDALAALWEKGSDVASAGAVALGEGGFFHVTGTTTITDIDFATAKDGRWAWVVFDGILTLTHNATTLILPGGANITTAAGDRALFIQDNSDNVYCAAYIRASGKSVVPPAFSEVTSKPTTLSGYGITDAALAINSGAVSVADDAVGELLTVPANTTGFLIVSETSARVSLFAIETFGTHQILTLALGANSLNGGVSTPTGGSGTDANVNWYLGTDGIVRVSNRIGATSTFRATVIIPGA